MDKKKLRILGVSAAAVLVLCVGVFCIFNMRGVPAAAAEEEPAEVVEPVEEKIDYEVPKIKAPVREVIPDETDGDDLPDPDVIETTDGDGNVTQTPNWSAQKELKEGTDLTDPDTVPEYKGSTSGSSAAAGSSTPKNGDTKIIDGNSYTYVRGFGWVKDGGPNEIEEIDDYIKGPEDDHVGY